MTDIGLLGSVWPALQLLAMMLSMDVSEMPAWLGWILIVTVAVGAVGVVFAIWMDRRIEVRNERMLRRNDYADSS